MKTPVKTTTENEVKSFKFAYIDPASATHTFFFYEYPEEIDKGVFHAYNAAGTMFKVKLQKENIVPLK